MSYLVYTVVFEQFHDALQVPAQGVVFSIDDNVAPRMELHFCYESTMLALQSPGPVGVQSSEANRAGSIATSTIDCTAPAADVWHCHASP